MSTQENPFDNLPVDPGPVEPRERMATDRQEHYIRNLIKERDYSGLPDHLKAGIEKERHTFAGATNAINLLLEAPVVDRDPPEGIHYFDDNVYKVQVAHHGSGKKYAKRLIVGSDLEGDAWLYEGRSKAFHQLSGETLMTLEQAQGFGRLYGMCCVCGRTLTDEGSIEAGIGPVCARRF